MNLVSLRQAILKTVSNAFEKKFDRNQLDEGVKHSIQAIATVDGSIDGIPFSVDVEIDSTTTVGFNSHRASSWTPQAESQLAYTLELIDLAFGPQASSEIVADIRRKFAETGTVPASEKYSAIVAELAASMRQESQVPVSGSVSVKHAANKIEVKLESGVAA